MLNSEAPFPHPGSPAFLRGSAQPVRIIQHDADGETVLVQKLQRKRGGGMHSSSASGSADKYAPLTGATANCRVKRADLFEDTESAAHGSIAKAQRARRSRAAGGRV